MTESPAFYIPSIAPEQEEEAYAQLAAACCAQPAPLDKRIRSIVFNHDGIEWTATVGEGTKGVERKTVKRGGKKVEQVKHHQDAGIVLAIFPGNPFCVYVLPPTRWQTPFFWAGVPTGVKYFSLRVKATA